MLIVSLQDLLEHLPFAALVVKDDEQDLNHQNLMTNAHFRQDLGWSLVDIPDKNTWWQLAYPDENYQKVVARQWELAVETYDKSQSDFICMEANIKTKFNGVQRYRVYKESCHALLEGHYLLFFVPIETAQR